VNIPGDQVLEGTATLIFVLDPQSSSGSWRQAGVAASTSLDRGLLVGRDHELKGTKTAACELAGIEVEHLPGLCLEVRVAREDPTPKGPGAESILVQPAPDRGA